MSLTIRTLTPAERKYTYAQSRQLIGQSGSIGHLRADFGDGEQFHLTWWPYQEDRNTPEFKAEFGEVINALRFDQDGHGILASRRRMTAYCDKHPESRYGPDSSDYGVRVDTEQYAYLLRLNPTPGVYNLYAYCYVKQSLDRHLKNTAQGIRFITPEYRELFKIPDGDKIRIRTSDGKAHDRTCRYIDETHMEVEYATTSELFHICQFAELTQRAGSTVIPLRSSLPEKCFAVAPGTDEIVIITKGADGWEPAGQRPEGCSPQEGADLLNEQMGVTPAQSAAMLAGISQGWASTAADPTAYDAQGNPLNIR